MIQAELAKELGITLRSVQNYELGARYPKTETIERIANIFGVDQNALISDEEYFIVEAKQKRGKRGQESAERLIRNANALFAGGDLSDEDKKNVFAALQKAYNMSTEINKKYTPKKYRKDSEEKNSEE